MRAITVSTEPVDPLADINDVTTLSEDDAPLMQELHDVLQKYNALKRFGITLLHQQFSLADDEVLVESTNRATRIQTIEPVKLTVLQGLDAIETSWRLDTGKPVMNCKCIRFSRDEHQHQSRG